MLGNDRYRILGNGGYLLVCEKGMNFNSICKVLILSLGERNMEVHYVSPFTFLFPYFSLFKKSQRQKYLSMQKIMNGQRFETAVLKEREGERKNILSKNNLLDIFLRKAF